MKKKIMIITLLSVFQFVYGEDNRLSNNFGVGGTIDYTGIVSYSNHSESHRKERTINTNPAAIPPGLELIDLRQASVIADRAHRMRHVPLPGLIPGREGLTFNSTGQDISQDPANLVMLFPDNIRAEVIEVVTFRNDDGVLSVDHFEVYAWNGADWELIGDTWKGVQISDTPEGHAGIRIDLKIIDTKMLRIRLRGTERSKNNSAQVQNIRLFRRTEVDDSNRTVVDSSLQRNDRRQLAESAAFPEEEKEMRLLTRFLQNRGTEKVFNTEIGEPTPVGKFDPAKGYLGYVLSFLDKMLEIGTDRYGDIHSPVFMAILDVRTHVHPGYSLPTTGPRQHDRAHFGANLQFDIPLLEALEAVTDITGERKYRQAGRDYLKYWLDSCTQTVTGLWPWGEHVYWDVYLDQPESKYYRSHEFNDDPPESFWERAWSKNQEAVTRLGDGVRNHIIDFEEFAFNRHAHIDVPLPNPRPPELVERLKRGNLDFPRQSGYWIRLWAFLYAKTVDDRYLSYIEEVLDHYDEVLIPEIGLLPLLSVKSYRPLPDRPDGIHVAVSLNRATPYLVNSPIYERISSFAQSFSDSLHHLLPNGIPDVSYGRSKDDHRPFGYATEDALDWVHLYRRFEDPRFINWPKSVAEAYAAVDNIPYEAYAHIRADFFGTAVNLFLDMHELDGGPQWLPAAEKYAQWAIERLYINHLFLGATNTWYYDANLRVSRLVHSLVRLHATLEMSGAGYTVSPVYFRPSRAEF